ncbi:MAG: quercetin 2,3-dioxygenase [Alphaproteobacteria bacterium CG11_big_fil_rev_8_21_14_0_20_44_7]|nr:MAG: quercetin 2,3-dioxygenase [Alphaproteobacteria bacterium CG11_big_fil_rev_8_21_14_0_20_44_7]
MIEIYKAVERGVAKIDWLESYHVFSFASFYNKKRMNFRSLRVINDDVIQPSKGFATHPHDNMEIVTFVLEGELAHKDSMGNGSVIKVGDVQRMSAGSGITHSEFNNSDENKVHLLQVWLLPEKRDIEPSYEQKNFSQAEKQGKLKLLVSGDGRDGSVSYNQSSDIYGAVLDGELRHKISKPYSFVYLYEGQLEINGQKLETGDSAAISDETALGFYGNKAGFLLFELN